MARSCRCYVRTRTTQSKPYKPSTKPKKPLVAMTAKPSSFVWKKSARDEVEEREEAEETDEGSDSEEEERAQVSRVSYLQHYN